MNMTPIVTAQEWETARKEMQVKEKEFTAPATRCPQSAGGCRGWPSRRTTSSRGPKAR